MDNLVLRSPRVVLPDGVRPAAIEIADGRITHIHASASAGQGAIDFGDLVISPGIVDTHVHVNEPGRTDWEGFDTATRAAAAGGVTTIVDMPLNSVPATTTVAALEAKREAARRKCHVDVAFWGGVVPGNARHLDALVDAGVRGFKCFLVPSGVDEFPSVDERDLRDAMPILARRGVPLLVHAEDPRLVGSPERLALQQSEDPRIGSPERLALQESDVARAFQASVYYTYLSTRPPEAEVEAIRLIVRLAREFGARMHIVHVASLEAADEIARAKADGIQITAETCPHYLTFAAEEIADGATEFKCAPPIREARHRDALLDALDRGTLDLIASDHSPAPPAMKCGGDFLRAWGGIASLEIALAAAWTALAARLKPSAFARPIERATADKSPYACEAAAQPLPPVARRLQPSDEDRALRTIAHWMSEAPARLAGLDRKGRIAVGCDADFVVWNPDATRVIDPSSLQQRHKLTPYAGHTLRGVVRATFVRGVQVWRDDRLSRSECGRLL